MARDKKWWAIHVSAGVATALLIMFGITKCSGEKDERAAKEAAQADLLDASCKIEKIAGHVDSLFLVNREQADSIVVLNDSIVVLNDSLGRVNGELVDVRGRLADCEKSKAKATTSAKNTCPCEQDKKPVVKKTTPVPQPSPKTKTGPETKQVLQPVTGVKNNKEQVTPVAQPCQESKPVETRVEVSGNSQNHGSVVVANPGQAGAKTTITITDESSNNGTIVVNNGGTVNLTTANAKQAGAGCAKQNATVADTLKQAQTQQRASAAFVYVRRVVHTK